MRCGKWESFCPGPKSLRVRARGFGKQLLKLVHWLPKLERNVARDAEHQARLRELGWDVLVIWEGVGA